LKKEATSPKDVSTPTAPEPKERPRWLRGLLKGLLLFHIIAIVSWSMPQTPAAISSGMVEPSIGEWPLVVNDNYVKTSPVAQYICTVGVWQSWDMFSPDPSRRDVWGSAEIEYQDHTVKEWTFPRIATYGYFWKYEKERYRKYFERGHDESFYWLWPDLCLWIARQNRGEANNPPVRVRLYRHLKIPPEMPPFSEYLGNFWKAARAGRLSVNDVSPANPRNDGPYETTLLYEYPIDVEKL
jgi:hypothetical protein